MRSEDGAGEPGGARAKAGPAAAFVSVLAEGSDTGSASASDGGSAAGQGVYRVALVVLALCAVQAWPALLARGTPAGPAHDGVAPQAPVYRLRDGAHTRYLSAVAPLAALAARCRLNEPIREGDSVGVEDGQSGCVLTRRPLDASIRRRMGLKLPINELSAAELEVLSGVGPARARALAAARPFRDGADLMRARGIGPKRARALAPAVRFTAPTPLLTPPLPQHVASTRRKP